MSRLVGGAIELWWRTRQASMKKHTAGRDDEDEEPEMNGGGSNLGEIAIIVVACGFVLGEGVASILTLILRLLGVGQVSCWGCVKGVCGGCP